MAGRVIASLIYFSIEYISNFENVLGYKSHSYGTGYTATKLLRGLLNTILMLNVQPVFLWNENMKNNGKWKLDNQSLPENFEIIYNKKYTTMIQNVSICM